MHTKRFFVALIKILFINGVVIEFLSNHRRELRWQN